MYVWFYTKDLEKLQQLQVNLQKDPNEVYIAFSQDQVWWDMPIILHTGDLIALYQSLFVLRISS